jgi:WD40 repeat protein
LIRTLKKHAGAVCAIAFDPAGRTLASASKDGRINLFETATGRLLRTLKGQKHGFNDVSFDRAGRALVGGSDGGLTSYFPAQNSAANYFVFRR